MISLLIVAIAFVSFYFFTRSDDNINQEKLWYAKSLDYDFCGTVVSLQTLEQRWGYGYVECVVKSKMDVGREDSLNLNLKYNKSLRFLTIKIDGKIEILMQGIVNISKGDSICVSHVDTSVKVYRKGALISNQEMYKNLRDKWFE